MTKYLGVDFGSKKIGLAVSDEAGGFAFPETVIPAGPKAADKVSELCRERGIKDVVLGLPLTLSGEENEIVSSARAFGEDLKKRGLEVYWEKEFSSTASARGLASYMKGIRPDTARKSKASRASVDASAAAIILQRFLDKNKK